MSPLTHGLLGWTIAQPLAARRDRILCTVAAVLPDLDALGILVSREYYSEYHHTVGHNFLFSFLASATFSYFSGQRIKALFLYLISFQVHFLADLLGSGEGWGFKYFWPFHSWYVEFSPPFQWALNSWQNLAVTVLCLLFVLRQALKKERTIVEIFSVRWDKKVVNALKKWFA
jgi:hypothetical protein